MTEQDLERDILKMRDAGLSAAQMREYVVQKRKEIAESSKPSGGAAGVASAAFKRGSEQARSSVGRELFAQQAREEATSMFVQPFVAMNEQAGYTEQEAESELKLQSELARSGDPYAAQAAAFGQIGRFFANPDRGGKRLDVAAEAGIPMVAQVLATPLSPAVQRAVGAASSIAGNAIAQTRRLVVGEQEGFKIGRAIQAGAIGAVLPTSGVGEASALVKSPLLGAIGETAKVGAKIGAVSAASEMGAEVLEGEFDPDRIISAGLFPILVSGASLPIPVAAKAAGAAVEQVQKGVGIAQRTGVELTPGQLLPSRYAGVELASAKRGGDAASRIGKAYESYENYAGQMLSGVEEKPIVFNEISPYLRPIQKQQGIVDALSEATEDARALRDVAAKGVEDARASLNAAAEKQALDSHREASLAAFQSAKADIEASARDIFYESTVGRAASAREAIPSSKLARFAKDYVVQPAIDAISEGIEAGYARIPNLKKGFDTTPIRNAANRELELKAVSLEGPGQTKMRAAYDVIDGMFPKGEPVSLQQLRNAREELLRRVKVGEAISSAEDSALKKMAHEITDVIDSQASAVMGIAEDGVDLGDLLRKTNALYRRKMDILDKKGVQSFLQKEADPASIDSIVDALVNGHGLTHPLVKDVAELAAFTGKFSPEVSETVKNTFNTAIREGIITKASKHIDSSSGLYLAEIKDLANVLEGVGAANGTLEALGFGNRELIRQARDAIEKFGGASKMTVDQLDDILSNPIIQKASERSGLFKRNLEAKLGESEAKNAVVKADILSQRGELAKAEEMMKEAEKAFQKAGFDESAARQMLADYQADPNRVALSNPNISDKGFNQLYKSLMDTNAVSNADVSAFISALPENIQDRFKSRAMADTLATMRGKMPFYTEGKSSLRPEQVYKNWGDAANQAIEDNRSRLSAVFGAKTESHINDLLEVSNALIDAEREAEKYFQAAKARAETPFVGQARAAIHFVPDLIRKAEYELAGELLVKGVSALEGEGVAQGFKLFTEMQEAAQPIGAAAAIRARQETSDMQNDSQQKAAPKKELRNEVIQSEEAPEVVFRPPGVQ